MVKSYREQTKITKSYREMSVSFHHESMVTDSTVAVIKKSVPFHPNFILHGGVSFTYGDETVMLLMLCISCITNCSRCCFCS